MSEKLPSPAQAKRIAEMWVSWEKYTYCGAFPYPGSITNALVRQGWVEATGETNVYPNGAIAAVIRVSPAGLLALGRYLVKVGG